MRNRILIAILFAIALFATWVYANDPNTLVKPPRPKMEHVIRVDSHTIWITTTRSVTKEDLLRQKASIEKEIERKQAELAIVNKRLAAFD